MAPSSRRGAEARSGATVPLGDNVKWDSQGPVAVLLQQMMEDGEIPQAFAPKQVWMMRDEFQAYSLSKFRSGFHSMKTKVGFNLRPNGGGASKLACVCDVWLSRRSSLRNKQSHNSPCCWHHFAEASRAEDSDDDGSVINAILAGSQTKKKAKVDGQATLSAPLSSGVSEDSSVWVPLHISAVWKDSDMTQHMLVAIVLPSGVALHTLENVDVRVEGDGLELVVAVKCNVKTLHRFWMPEEKAVPPSVDVWSMMTAFSDKMATMRASEKSIVMSVARIPLDI